MAQITFKCNAGSIAVTNRRGTTTVKAEVDVFDMPRDLNLECNPRKQNMESNVALAIKDSLVKERYDFSNLNLGLVIIAAKLVKIDGDEITVEFTDDETQGVINGGHTYKAIINYVTGRTPKPGIMYCDVKFLIGDDPINNYLAIMEGLNTSVKVKRQSVDNKRGRYELLKEQLKDQPYYNRIHFQQNPEGDDPIDIAKIIAILRLFDIDSFGNYVTESHPTDTLNGATHMCNKYDAILKSSGETTNNHFVRVKNISTDIINLFDHIELNFPDYYISYNKKENKYGAISGEEKCAYKLAMSNRKAEKTLISATLNKYYVPNTVVFMMTSVFRICVDTDKDGYYFWKINPFEAVEEIGPAIANMIIQMYKESKPRSYSAIAKSYDCWKNLYNKALFLLTGKAVGNEDLSNISNHVK